MLMEPELARFQLSQTQRDIYLNQARYPNNPMYNIGGVIRLNFIDVERIQRAHAFMVNNHDAFGIRIHTQKEGVLQSISQQRDVSLPLIDFSREPDPEEGGGAWLDNLFGTYIDIENQHLFRCYLLKYGEQSYRYVAMAHHIAIDGWGFSNLARMVGVYYHNHQSQVEEQLQWSEVIAAEQEWIDSKRYKNSQQFWQSYLADKNIETLVQPQYQSEFNHTAIIPSQRQVLSVEQQRVERLKQLAVHFGVGIAQVFLAAVSLYFMRVFQRSTLSIGLPVHNRSGHNQKRLIGVFTSISPLLIEYEQDWDFPTLLKNVQQNQKQCFRHQRFPIGEMYRQLGQSQASAGLFDVAFNYLHLDSDLTFDGKTCDLVYWSHQHEQLPLMFNVWEYGKSNKIELQLDHNLAYFNADDGQQILQGIDSLLMQISQSDSILLPDVSIVPEAQVNVLRGFAEKGLNRPLNPETIVSMVEKTVAQYPHSVAVRGVEGTLCYAELNAAANQLAHYLRTEHGADIQAANESVIGVCLERTIWLPAIILGILKSGCAYVPLDPALPESRLHYIAKDANLCLLISNGPRLAINDCHTIFWQPHQISDFPNTNPKNLAAPNDLAYVIYTSGSTGAPKGVEILHRNSVSMLHWAQQSFVQEHITDVLFSTSLNFDLSIFELFLPLITGNTCVIVDNILTLPESGLQVSLINTVPSAMRALLENNGIPDCVKAINLAGEALPQDLLNGIFHACPAVLVRNLYGPSEDTTYSTEMQFAGPVSGSVPIGTTIIGSGFAVLDHQFQPLPVGIVGELFLCGEGVARGYRNQPTLSEQKFLNLSLFDLPDSQYYRTGDLVKVSPQGTLYYYGRADEQLKINGFRIEPGEIESIIRQSGMASDAVVVMQNISGQSKLVAYLVSQGMFDHQKFRTYLSSRLPVYMLPDAVELLPQMPLNSNGKVDKKRLPQLQVSTSSQLQDTSQWSEAEKQIQAIWLQLPGIDVYDRDISFFSVGGSSLAAMSLMTKLNKAFDVCLKISDIFEFSTIAQQAQYLVHAEKIPLDQVSLSMPEKSGRTEATLSAAQRRFWTAEQLFQGKSPFNIAGIYALEGQVDKRKLQQSLAQLVQRHSILRTRYVQQGDAVIQLVEENVSVEIEQNTLVSEPTSQELNDYFVDALQRPFDLSNDVFLRVTLFSGPDAAKHYLRIVSHHIAIDGWSIALLLQDWSALYSDIELPEVDYCYTDYAHWQQSQSQACKTRSLGFWRDYLEGAPVVHNLALDRRRREGARHLGQRHTRLLHQSLSVQLRQVCQAWQVTPFVLLKSAWALTLARFSNQADIVLGVPVAGRGDTRLDKVLGAFINTLCVRSQIDYRQTVKSWIQQEQRVFLQLLQHQELSFDVLVQELVTDTNKAHTPLFQLLFDYADTESVTPDFGALNVQKVVTEHEVLKYDLELYMSWQNNQLSAQFLYDQALFDYGSIEQFANLFEELLRGMICAPESALHLLPIMTVAEHNKLHCWNEVTANGQPVPDISEVLAEQFRVHAKKVAFISSEQDYSYQQCSDRIDDITLHLQQGGILAGDKVGLMMSRQLDLYLSMIAILRLGAAFVPLDPRLPEQRVAFIVENCQLVAMVSDGNIDHTWKTATTKHFDISEPATGTLQDISDHRGDSVAYVLYTSGSTGTPKGVPITRDALTNLIVGLLQSLSLPRQQTWLAMTTVSFDISLVEWLAPLFAGDSCYIADDAETANPDLLLDIIDNKGISMVSSTPSRWQQWFDLGWQGNPTITGMCAGELFPESLQKQLDGRVRQFFNLWGPTETTIYATCQPVDNEAPEVERLSIGHSMRNYIVVVIDQNNQLLPCGAVGELAVAGVSLSPGYIGLPEKNAERYFTADFGAQSHYSGMRFYKTGDLARLTHCGFCQFVNRIDNRVKIRGALVEPREVEVVLGQLPGIQQAVIVTVEKTTSTQLAAYYVTAAEQVERMSISRIRQQLEQKLPPYMIPDFFMELEAMPLTANFKIDFDALPEPELGKELDINPASTVTEIALAKIWAEVLEIKPESVCVDTDFFSLGGHSLLLAKLVNRVKQTFTDFGLSLAQFLADSRISSLAEHIEQEILVKQLSDTSDKKQSITL